MTEQDIIKTYGKSIWDMTAEEIIKNGLTEIWVELTDKINWWEE